MTLFWLLQHLLNFIDRKRAPFPAVYDMPNSLLVVPMLTDAMLRYANLGISVFSDFQCNFVKSGQFVTKCDTHGHGATDNMNKFSYHAISTCCLLTAGKVKYGVSYRDIICLLTYTAIKQVQVTHAVIKTHSR